MRVALQTHRVDPEQTRGFSHALRQHFRSQLDEQTLALRGHAPVARQVGDGSAAERLAVEKHARNTADERQLAVVEGAHVEGNAVLDVARGLHRVLVVAVQENVETNGVFNALVLVVYA